MSSPPSSSSPWTWDPNTKLWVRYDTKSGTWRDGHDRKARPPPSTAQSSSARQEYASHNQGASLRRDSGAGRDAALAATMERSRIRDTSPKAEVLASVARSHTTAITKSTAQARATATPGTGSRMRRDSEVNRDATLATALQRPQLQETPVSMGAQIPSKASLTSVQSKQHAQSKTAATSVPTGIRELTAEDAKAGVRTHWTISPTQQYTDPSTAQKRSFTVKHIRRDDDNDGQKSKLTRRDDIVSSKSGRAIGKIVEVRIVAPDSAGISAASVMISDVLGGEVNRARTRRFAVVQERPEGRDCFRAIAIKTYNGEGVSRQIKFHHSQIYSGRRVPPIRDDERPGLRNGQMERPMQGQAIRVVPYDRERMLDSMSRLDYCDSTDFDYADPQVRLFGRVHEDSEAALVTQWQSVMNTVIAAIRGPVSSRPSDVGSTHAQHGNTHGTGHPSGGSGAVATPGPSATPQRPPAPPATGSAGPESVSVHEVTRILRALREHANENELDWPAHITQAGLEQMAANRECRETALTQIRDNLNSQIRARNAEESSDEE